MSKTNQFPKPKTYLLFNAYMLLFVIHVNQVGVGLTSFQRAVVKVAGHDAWISVIIAGLATHAVVWIMIKVLKGYKTADLYQIHDDLFGKWLGKLINFSYVIFLFLAIVTITRNYVEIVQTWMFSDMPIWLLTLLLMTLILYAVTNGIRLIVGFCFLSFVLTLWLTIMLYYPLRYAEWHHLLPIYNTSMKNLFMGTYKMTFTVIGFEILYFIYPFIKDEKYISRYTHISLFFTTILYTVVTIVSIVYFSEDQITINIWSTLTLFKIVKLPFIERFEYIGVSLWMLVILPNLLLYSWAASRGLKHVFKCKQKTGLYFLVFASFTLTVMLKTRIQLNFFNDWVSRETFYVFVVYPFILFILLNLKKAYKQIRKKVFSS